MRALDKVIAKMEKGIHRDLAREYATGLRAVRQEIGVIYDRYAAADGTLSHADMTRYNRLRTLEKSIAGELGALTGKTAKLTRAGLGKIHEEGYYRTAFDLETGVKAKLAFGKLDSKAVQASVQNPISGLTLNERLARDRAAIILNCKATITQGIIRGSSYPEMSRELKRVFEGDLVKARRVVATEAHRVKEQARAEAIDHAVEQGVKLIKIWVATIDGSTRDDHADMDGREADADGLFWIDGLSAEYPGGFGDPAQDINCRCTVRTEIQGFEPKVRRVRGEGVIPYVNYDDWREGRIG